MKKQKRGMFIFYDIFVGELLSWNVPLLIIIILIAFLYALSITYLTDIKVYHRQPIFFLLSLSLFYVTVGSPFTTISHLSFSLHMIQMSILYFIVPPLLISGIPTALWQRVWKLSKAVKGSRWLSTPKASLILFSVLFFMYHLPAVLTYLLNNPVAHQAMIYLLLILAFLMWWPLVSLDSRHLLYGEQKRKYASLSGILLMPACLLFIFSAIIDGINNPFLTQLTAHLCITSQSLSVDMLPPPFHTRYDQGMAGVFMLGIHKVVLMVLMRQ
ncbi:cytochrome c oxidase assembly protein [Oceanobacillus kimchii]|uniref:cytochrome c oxidase assembly protein n=1 Tax=Oceanobacillus kimchii TaxID=746691 RepID=UPI0021A3A8B4|nr:cytochrome c oxidase assembly protein [Oceanobacillus kimchii]MCT1576975.1 cytochrome c oxidase assembly protein [Oceanobacillus kimchii]MCT2135045.1 cytochrome c oxidase assembly protein [Oceanobacillus kimchii]